MIPNSKKMLNFIKKTIMKTLYNLKYSKKQINLTIILLSLMEVNINHKKNKKYPPS
jgi:hypothetical protein